MKRTIFKYNDRVVYKTTSKLFPNQIDEMKWEVSASMECDIELVTVETEDLSEEFSVFDVDATGTLIDWTDGTFEPVTGLEVTGTIDDLLDSISDGTLNKLSLK